MISDLLNIFEQTSDAVFGIDKQGHIQFWNSACSALFGYSPQQAEGRHCSSLLCGKDLHEREFCSRNCPVPKQNSDQYNVHDFDLLVKQASGDRAMVNINAYYTPLSLLHNSKNISVFFCLRRVNCQRLIRRLTSSSCQTEGKELIRANKLTKRELGILRLAGEGKKTENIASQLCISQSTVRNHFKNIYRKLDVHSRAEAISNAMNLGLI